MNSICLISSDNSEIEQFLSAYPNGKIISDIEGYLPPYLDEVDTNLSHIASCIIGETVNYSDEYILTVLRLCEQKHIAVYNYHTSIKTYQKPFQEIKIPVVFICSLLPDMEKSQIGLKITQALSKEQYNPLYIP